MNECVPNAPNSDYCQITDSPSRVWQVNRIHVWIHTYNQLCLEGITVHGNACLGPIHSLYSNYSCCAPIIAVVVTNFNLFSYDTVWGRESNTSPARLRANALSIMSQLHLAVGLNATAAARCYYIDAYLFIISTV